LRDDTRNVQFKAIVAPMIFNAAATEKPDCLKSPSRRSETPAPALGRPGVLAIFASPLGWVMLLTSMEPIFFAAYEVAAYRNQPVETVCGLAAIRSWACQPIISSRCRHARPERSPLTPLAE